MLPMILEDDRVTLNMACSQASLYLSFTFSQLEVTYAKNITCLVQKRMLNMASDAVTALSLDTPK